MIPSPVPINTMEVHQWLAAVEGLRQAVEVRFDAVVQGEAGTWVDGASLCQTAWSPVVWLGSAGPVSDLSEVLVKGCEPAALDVRVAPARPAGPAPARVVASCKSWR